MARLLYRAPRTFAYQWSRDGTDIAGATSSRCPAGLARQLSCKVTASNFAGSGGPQISGAHTGLGGPPAGPAPSPAAKKKKKCKKAKKGMAAAAKCKKKKKK